MQTLHRNTSYRCMIIIVVTALLALILSPLGTHPAVAAGAWQTVGSAGFSASYATFTDLAIDSSGTPYVAFVDFSEESKVTVMKFDGTDWVLVGPAGFSAGVSPYISLEIDASGTPFVAYKDGGNSGKATVMKFDGTSWVPVGPAGLTAGPAEYPSLAIDASGTPYLAYDIFVESEYEYQIAVMKFDGNTWVPVGDQGFSAGAAYDIGLAFDASGALYASFTDVGSDNKATVMKFEGTNWVPVGPVGFSTGSAAYPKLVFDASDTPYVSYMDGAKDYRATVVKFNGTNWASVGEAGFSTDIAEHPSVAIDASDTLYIAYRDLSKGGKATMMKFDGESWVPVGPVGFSADFVNYISLAIDANGTPYVAFMDGANDYRATVMKHPMVRLKTAIAGNGVGVVNPAAGVHYYEPGDQVHLIATASTGSTFTGWSGDPACTDGPVTITADMICTATFTLDTFTLTPSAGSNGSISPSGAQTVNYGSSFTFTITPDPGYRIADVTVDEVSQGAINSYTFNSVAANHTLAAAFAPKPPSGLSAKNDGPTTLGAATSLESSLTEGAEMTFTWDFGDGTTGSGAAVTHTYTAAGTYTAKVTASNAAGSLQAETTVYVTTNPIARAESTQTVRTSSAVILDGSASSDPGDFLPLTYQWKQTSGPAVTLTGANTAIASFDAPATTQTMTLTFELVVTNAQGLESQPRVVVVTVEPYQIFLTIIHN